MSGALALVPSEQDILLEMQDGVLMEEESVLNVKKEKSKKGSSKDDQDNHELKEVEEEEEAKGGSKEKQVKENEAKSQSNQNEASSQINRGSHTGSPQVTQNEARSQSNQNEASGSRINRSSQTTSTQDAWRDLKLTFSSDKKKVKQEEAGNSKAVTFLKETGKFALKTVAISGAVIGGTALLLPVLGFGPLGPIAGSLAAAYQSSVGAVAAGSVFSTLQSAGMVGLSAAAKGGIVAGSAVVSAATSKSKPKSDDKKKK